MSRPGPTLNTTVNTAHASEDTALITSPLKSYGTASIPSSIFNLSNTIVGAGVITLPYALRSAGTIIGCVMLIVTCIASMFSFSLLIRLHDATGLFSYRDIAVRAYGMRMAKICELILICYTAGTCIGRGVLIGDFIPRVFAHWLSSSSLWVNRDFIIAAVAVVFMLPLSLPQRLDALQYSSLLALVCVVYTLGVLADHLADTGIEPSVKLLAQRSSTRIHVVTNTSCLVALIMYLAYALIGYFQFGEHTQGDVLNNFSPDWVPVLIARLTLGLALILSYPLVLFALRENLDSFLFRSASPVAAAADDPPYWRFKALTVAIVLITNGIAIATDNVATVFGFSGSVFGVAIVYILPGLFYVRLYHLMSPSPAYYYGAWALIIGGAIGGIVSVTVNVLVLTSVGQSYKIDPDTTFVRFDNVLWGFLPSDYYSMAFFNLDGVRNLLTTPPFTNYNGIVATSQGEAYTKPLTSAEPFVIGAGDAQFAALVHAVISDPDFTDFLLVRLSCNNCYPQLAHLDVGTEAGGGTPALSIGIIQYCDPFPALAGGTVAFDPLVNATTAAIGDTLALACHPPAYLSGTRGSPYVACRPDRTWSSDPSTITCVPPPPPPPPSPPPSPPPPSPPPPYACPLIPPLVGGTITYSNFGYTGSVATIACDPGISLVSGPAIRTCIGGSWSGNITICEYVECAPLSVPVNGNVVCSGASNTSHPAAYGETCAYSCNAGFSVVGDVSRTCSAGSAWSGSFAPFCSSLDIALSFVTLDTSPPLTLDAGADYNIYYSLRDVNNIPTSTGTDLLFAGALGSSNSVLTSITMPTTGEYTAVARAPTTIGTFVYHFAINNLPITNGLTSLTVTTRPGPASPTGSYLVDLPPSGTLDQETGKSVWYTVHLADAYGNALAQQPPADHVSVTIKSGGVSRLIEPVYVAADTLAFELVVDDGGTYTLVVEIAGDDILGSPFVLSAAATCAPGSRVLDGVRCTTCGAGSYSDEINSPTCTACPEFTASPEASPSFLNCTCLPTFWFGYGPRTRGKPCVPCPIGAVCAGGNTPPRAAPGYETTDDGSAFVACPQQAACAGDGRCSSGYTGRLCAQCASGYYRLSDSCRKCKGSNAVIVVVLVVLVLVYVTGVVWINTRNTKVYGYASFVIALNTLQSVALYGTIRLEWHPIAEAVFDAVSLVNLNLDLASPECGLDVGDVWMFKWGMTMALPVLFLLPFAVVTAAVNIAVNIAEAKSSPITPNPRVLAAAGRGYLQTILLLYLPLMYAALRYVDCTDVGGGIVVMTTNPERRCYTGAWYGLLPMILTVAAGYGLSIPTVLAVFLRRQHRRLDMFSFVSRYAFLVARYKPHLYGYELVILGRKLFVVVAVCAFRSATVKATLVALFLACHAVVSLALRHRPYIEDYHNILDAITVLCSFVLLWGGTITSSHHLRDAVVITSLLALLAVVILGVAYEVWRIRARDEAAVDRAFAGKAFSSDDVDDVFIAAAGPHGSFAIDDVQHLAHGSEAQLVINDGIPLESITSDSNIPVLDSVNSSMPTTQNVDSMMGPDQ
ncbi:uncharacterized protein AMSG_12410 [Thecamonas trahens ATCC 50062]|uniref:Sushi domain-containing protein n=1 Tax=Thecamonas trahens ATCC 50062 TaxID=461836 RepID=A0A0L0DSQ4_THETB|nr:hypothetical protein AMSG_12410 [Thecamonas trahens ATCC 50062]KNC55379.1 hypothetical protein AMSG_12410 [Thecamonas trahens ATCC 50062]|eukprot:XP_013753032.1 hypothetical protein AMSG_12410 [Thecamonas trahens ATCC 50062]